MHDGFRPRDTRTKKGMCGKKGMCFIELHLEATESAPATRPRHGLHAHYGTGYMRIRAPSLLQSLCMPVRDWTKWFPCSVVFSHQNMYFFGVVESSSTPCDVDYCVSTMDLE